MQMTTMRYPNMTSLFKYRTITTAEALEDVYVNPNAQQREIWLRDLDGYVVVLAGRQEDVDESG